jgi:hypothetical protein
MVVNDLYIVRIPSFPDKTDAPLIIDSNAMLMRSISLQFLQAIGWRDPQCIEFACGRQYFKFARRKALNIFGKFPRKPPIVDSFRFPTFK